MYLRNRPFLYRCRKAYPFWISFGLIKEEARTMKIKKEAFKAVGGKVVLIILGLLAAQLFIMQKAAAALNAEVIERPKEQYQGESLRSPFKPYYVQEAPKSQQQPGEKPAEPEKPLPPLAVSGIIAGGNMPQAIINDKIVMLGTVIDGATVVKITKEGVTVLFNNKMYDISSPAVAEVKQAAKVEQNLQGGRNER
jgi:hypothetical protein